MSDSWFAIGEEKKPRTDREFVRNSPVRAPQLLA
jgi:hypothetical protein